MADVETEPQTNDATSQELALTAPSTTTVERKTKKIIRKKRQPARVQIDPAVLGAGERPVQTSGTTFNIWYNKWAGGDREDAALSQTKAKGRCVIKRDTGYTKGDKIQGSYFCLYFARGICTNGSDCEFLHRLPTLFDIFRPNVDLFGREKHGEYRDDMGGVGSFMRQNRTIYCGRIHVTDDIEEIVARHFAEWGQVERIRVLNTRGVAFITYTNEQNASFAKEAMAHQSLDHDEVLNVRWATADPNPMAQAREARRIEEQAAEAVRRALPEAFVAEIEGRDPEARKRKKIDGGFGLEGYDAPDDVYFARGASAVNPVGREGFELEDEQRLLLEQGINEDQESVPQQILPPEDNGIFSGATLAALQKARGGFTQQTSKRAATGPLVAYGSDSEDE